MRLLIATGGSPHSDTALRMGAHILYAGHAREIPTVMTVIKQEVGRSRAERILAHAREILQPVAAQVRTKVRVGRRAVEIVREVEENNYDLIIVGERPVHRLITRFLGSTATRVMAQAPCPVMVVKAETGPIQRILLCDSGAESPSLLNRFKAQLAELSEGQVELTILHVMSQMSAGPGVRGAQLRAGAEELIREHSPEGELLARDVKILEDLDVNPQAKVRHGLVVDEIVAEARSGDYDLVVIGAHQSEGWQRFLLDDLAHQIIVKVDRPILVIR